MLLWVEFFFCALAIVYSGTKLAKYGDILVEKTGLGGTWIGGVLMAPVTSLPELITGISSVTYAGVPDIAVGDALGACALNLLILAFLDGMYRPGPICTKAGQGHLISAGFGVLLLGSVGVAIVGGDRFPSFRWISALTPIIIVVYCFAVKLIYTYEKRQIRDFLREIAVELKYNHISMPKAVLHYGINAAVVIAAAGFLPGIGARISEATGLGQTFVGNIFIAFSTTLPELAVSTAAVRIGAVDLAVGNLFANVIFNVFVIAIDDLFFVRGPLTSFISPGHISTVLSTMVMIAISIIGLTYRAERKRLFLAWDSFAIIAIYFSNVLLLYPR